MKNSYLLLFSAFAFFVLSCGNPDSTTSKTEAASKEVPSQTVETEGSKYPLPDEAMLKNIWEKCDFVDYVFYQLPISISIDGAVSSVQPHITFIGNQPVQAAADCAAIGRVFFQINGENAAEADLHWGPSCAYYIFYVDGKKTYASQVSAEGIGFFNKALSQVKATPRN